MMEIPLFSTLLHEWHGESQVPGKGMNYPYKVCVCGTRAAAKHSAQGWGVKEAQL